MKPASFAYVRPAGVTEAARALADGGQDAKLIAGGQSLVPMLNLRLAQPALLVDIGRLEELRFIRRHGSRLDIGALTRHSDFEHSPAPFAGYTAFLAAAPHIGHAPIRARGTFGGSIAHADPTAEWCTVTVLYGGTVTVSGSAGIRTVGIEELLVGPFMTMLDTDEIVLQVSFDRPAQRSAFREAAAQHGDFATAAAGVAFHVRDGRIARPRVAVAGLGGHPGRALAVEAVLDGTRLDADLNGLREECRHALAAVADGQSERQLRVCAELVLRATRDAAG